MNLAVDIECVVDAKAECGESPVWCPVEQRLYWVDIDGKTLHRFDPASGLNETWPMPEEIGCVAPRQSGGLLAGMRSGYFGIDLETGALTRLGDPEPDKPDNRFNDGTVDPAGRFWAGTMRMSSAGRADDGVLYRIDPDLSCHAVLGHLWTVNGLAFSPDGRRMYLSDTNANVQTIWVFDYDPDDGVAENRRVFATTHDLAGRPDGGAVDADGCYWMAGVGGWQLVRFTPDGDVDRIIEVPVERPSKVAFGGPDLDVMYVTSIGRNITSGTLDRQPQAGGLFAVQAGVTGVSTPRFAG